MLMFRDRADSVWKEVVVESFYGWRVTTDRFYDCCLTAHTTG
jgi:hypothetical protein